jgi:hypothetical protein
MASRSRQLFGLVGWGVGLGLLTSGCLLKDDTSTWYLDPTGAVSWSVVEKDVRSDAQTAIDRQNEELSYIGAARAQNHPVARGLNQLGPMELRTRLLRATVPFTVITEAKFAGIDRLGTQIISRSGLTGTSVLSRDPEGTTWTLTAIDPHAVNGASEPDDDLSALPIDGLKVVLLEGRFLSAEGFDLSADRRVATLLSFDSDPFQDKATMALKLKWK